MTVGERLKTLRKHRKYNQTESAELIGINQQSWALMEKDKRKLTGEEAKILAKEFDSSVHWLFTGDGPMTGKQILAEIKSIRVVNIAALAGLVDGYSAPEMEYVGTLSLPGIDDPENYIATNVSGRSMEPDIREGSIIVLQRMMQRSEFIDGRVYVIVLQGIPFLKRIKLILNGKDKGRFQISSDNESNVQVVDGDEITQWFRLACVVNWVR